LTYALNIDHPRRQTKMNNSKHLHIISSGSSFLS